MFASHVTWSQEPGRGFLCEDHVTLAHDKGQLQVSSQLWVMLYLPFIMVFSHEWL